MFVESVLASCCSHGAVGRSHIDEQLARLDGHRPVLQCSNPSALKFQRRKIEKSDRSKLKTMLTTMQVTMGK
jgi:hypothetical protein